MYWMFGFKYWVISIEVPRLIAATKEGSEANHKSICSETSYDALNWVGIIVNLIFCLYVGWKRGMLMYDSAFDKHPHELGVTVMILYAILTILLIVSALFLADALRRFKKSFGQDKRLVVNQKTMCLHIIALFIHTFFISVTQAMTIYTFMEPAPFNYSMMVVARMVRDTSQSISQIIVIYLFVQFSKPAVVKTEEGESDSEEERRDMNLDMMYYVKNMPTVQMKRIKDVDYDIDKYTSAKEYLYDNRGEATSFIAPYLDNDNDEIEEGKIESFTNEIQKNWGEQES